MQEKNRLCRIVSRINKLPAQIKPHALSFVFGRAIRFAGTSKIRVESLSEKDSLLTLKNRKRVQNHIGSVHAAAMALLAESATGFIVGMNVPDRNLIVIKSMKVSYIKRSKGDLTARARLTESQLGQIRTDDKGDVLVDIRVTDETGAQPIKCHMTWAWTPQKRTS